jgi:hypothetical protein
VRRLTDKICKIEYGYGHLIRVIDANIKEKTDHYLYPSIDNRMWPPIKSVICHKIESKITNFIREKTI